MTYTLIVPVDMDKVHAGAWHLIAHTKFPGIVDANIILSLADFEDDLHQHAMYEMLMAMQARSMLMKADPPFCDNMICRVVGVDRKAGTVAIEFQNKDEAMLFKLAYGGTK